MGEDRLRDHLLLFLAFPLPFSEYAVVHRVCLLDEAHV